MDINDLNELKIEYLNTLSDLWEEIYDKERNIANEVIDQFIDFIKNK